MKSTIHIETYTKAAYRAIRPALVASINGFLGVCNSTFSATINKSEYDHLVEVVRTAAQSAGIPRDEYDIKTVHAISR